jgi:hypothetical protein
MRVRLDIGCRIPISRLHETERELTGKLLFFQIFPVQMVIFGDLFAIIIGRFSDGAPGGPDNPANKGPHCRADTPQNRDMRKAQRISVRFRGDHLLAPTAWRSLRDNHFVATNDIY